VGPLRDENNKLVTISGTIEKKKITEVVQLKVKTMRLE